MGQITSLFVHKVVNAAVTDTPANRTKRRTLFERVGLNPDAPIDPKLMVSDQEYYELCEAAARVSELGAALTLKVGASMRCDDYGAFGLAWKSAVDLSGSYERAARYARVLTSVSVYEVITEAGKHYMTLHREGPRRLGLRLSNEQTMAAVTQISREVCPQPFTPEAVYFKHPAPGTTSAHEEYFGCPVHFGSDRDALAVSAEKLQIPNRLGDPTISEFFDTHMEQELAELEDNCGLGKRVRIQVAQALSEGVPSLIDIARRLNMSSRTLQRRLADQALSFQTLVDDSRRELSERLLNRTHYSLSEIAFLTGFSEQSAFNRAFKRWAGKTPRSYRLDVQSGR